MSLRMIFFLAQRSQTLRTALNELAEMDDEFSDLPTLH